MKKQNLFKITFSAAVLITAVLFTGCPREAAKTHNQDAIIIPIPTISFNITNAKALASTQTSSNRAASDAESNSFLQKVLENGTVQDALDIEYEGNFSKWAKLDAVIKPPASANSTDILLYFDAISEAAVSEDFLPNGTWYLGQLILVHEDNTYDDIVMMDSDGERPDHVSYSSCARYTNDGRILYLAETEDWGYNFKSYNPSTKKTSLIFHLDRGDTNSLIMSFQISEDGKYVYFYIQTHIDELPVNFLKIVSTDDPSDTVELGKITYGVDGWAYSPYDDCLYYAVRDKEKEDHVFETGEDFYFIYKIDKTGKGEKEHLPGNFCPAIIPTAKDKTWRLYYVGIMGDDTIRTLVLENFASPDADNPETIELNIPNNHSYSYEFLQVGDIAYLLHDYINEAFTMTLHTIYAVNTTTKQALNVMQKIPDYDKIAISSWSVNEKDLFISGFYEDGTAANFKVDLSTLEPTEIDSATAFTCIAAL